RSACALFGCRLALAAGRRALLRRFCLARRGGALLRRPAGAKLRDHFTRYRIGDAQATPEVLEHVARLVQQPDHFGARVDDVLERPPLPDQAEGLLAGPHQPSAAESFEGVPQLAVYLDEVLRLTRLDPESHDVECRHVACSFVRHYPAIRLIASVEKCQDSGAR